MNPSIVRPLAAFVLALSMAISVAHSAKADALWDSSPYQVEVTLRIEGHCLSESQAMQLRRALIEKINQRVGLFWQSTFATSGEASESAFDKRFMLSVQTDRGAFLIEAVEHDIALDHAGLAVRRTAPTSANLSEAAYQTLFDAFRPLARVQRDPKVANRVTLAYRAERLAPTGALAASAAGEVMLPFRSKRGRDGSAEGTQPVRWTYLLSEGPSDRSDASSAAPGAAVVSHSRRPFGTRPSGRIEYLAIAAPSRPGESMVLRLRSQADEAVPLPGYEVLIGEPGSVELRSLGFTDEKGRVTLPAEPGVVMAHIKCGTLVVASLPIARGIVGEIAIPLIDERSRLRAELEVTSLREELIDTVARRKILGERIRRLVADERVDAAKRLLDDLEELPGRTQFTRRLESAQRGAGASHPLAKARLDRLFDKTKSVLNSALDPRETRDLAIAIDRARQDLEIRESSGSTEPAS